MPVEKELDVKSVLCTLNHTGAECSLDVSSNTALRSPGDGWPRASLLRAGLVLRTDAAPIAHAGRQTELVRAAVTPLVRTVVGHWRAAKARH